MTLSPAEQESLHSLHRQAVWAKEHNQLVKVPVRAWSVLVRCAIEQTRKEKAA